jgi:uncharacterized membrane protein
VNNHLFHHTKHPHAARNVNEIHESQMGIGAKIADAVTGVMGSWKFIIIQTVIVAFWITANVWLLSHPFDPFPLILLNLVFSTQAAYASPLILMSQNRQSIKDRITADETYRNAQKGEEETRAVMEHLTSQDTELLTQTRELLKQTDLLEAQAARIEKLLKRIDAATGRGAA